MIQPNAFKDFAAAKAAAGARIAAMHAENDQARRPCPDFNAYLNALSADLADGGAFDVACVIAALDDFQP